MEPLFFESPTEFRAWLEKHHATAAELLVGFHRKRTGRPTMTWPESVDEALCFGWIDGVRRGIDTDRYSIRFTPRKRTSTWSRVNIAKVAALSEEGRMRPAGRAAFEARTEANSGIYSFENEARELTPEFVARFETEPEAWAWYQAQPAGYRRQMTYRVVSAKRPETREKRFVALLAASIEQRRIP